jgi:glycosyltransferase involved in cell wall biosynthesis
MWSGSEELWAGSAKSFIKKGCLIAFASKYSHKQLCEINGRHYIYYRPYLKPTIKKVIEKLFKIKFKNRDVIQEIIAQVQPDLVILSQGNNIDLDGVMETCCKVGVPYITITQLVSECHFLNISSTNILHLQQGYLKARRNFFVSERNLQLNNLMLSLELSNAEVVYNPCKVKKEGIPGYPRASATYNVGLVGRLECFHKGYDLLLELASKDKWRNRAVHFNIYGEGPHEELIKFNIERLKLNNITLKGHANRVETIWEDNHILLMPSRMEGQALALIEAMYCKRSAIVTNVGGAAELIEDGLNGFVADSATVSALDEALERAWRQKENWKEFGNKASVALKEKYPADAIEYFNEKIQGFFSSQS